MADSENQFQELLAHLVARANKMLAQQSKMLPLSLLLRADGKVEIAIGVADASDQMSTILSAMQASLATVVSQEQIEATCIAYPNYEDQTVVALLENNENYCATVIIPVLSDPSVGLDIGNIQVEDGEVYVFPLADST